MYSSQCNIVHLYNYVLCHLWLCLHAVPELVVSLVSDTSNPVLSGSSPTLTCTAELSSVRAVVNIKAVWTGPNGRTIVSASNVTMKSLTLYRSSYTLNSVESSDSGAYTCTMSIESGLVEVSTRTNITIGK